MSMVDRVSDMDFVPEGSFEKVYGSLILRLCMEALAQAFAALPGSYVAELPSVRSAEFSISEKQASFASDICEAEASGRHFEKSSLALDMSETVDDYVAPENRCEVNSSICGGVGEGPNVKTRTRQKDINAWLALAKSKDDDDDEDEEYEDDDDDEDNDDAADEEDGGDEDEGEEEVEGNDDGGGEDDDDNDDDDEDDDENGKGDDEENEENVVEAEDEEDEDSADDEEDEDEEDDDDEPQEPPQKKRK